MRIAIDKPLAALTSGEKELLLDRRPSDEPQLQARVGQILAEVREEGDPALFRMAREFDGVELPALEVTRDRWT